MSDWQDRYNDRSVRDETERIEAEEVNRSTWERISDGLLIADWFAIPIVAVGALVRWIYQKRRAARSDT